jgi:PAS domain S-box-containing protein
MPQHKANVVRLPNVPALSWDDCRLLVESVADYALFMLDADGFIASWNLGAEKIEGYAASEIIGEHFSKFYTPEDLAVDKPRRELAIAAECGRVEDEGWRVRKDGSRFWADVVITALRDKSGALRGFGKVTRDLTARRAAEEELRRSEERFRLLVEGVTDYALYMLDTEGRVTTWNVGAERMKGYKPHEVIGKSFAVFFPEEDARNGKPMQELAHARDHGRFEDEGWRVRKDGTRLWANAVLTSLRDSNGELVGFAKITRDLTARREAEETARRLLKEQTARVVAEEGERRLRESEERYRDLSKRLEIIFEGVAEGITVQDRTGRVVFANSAAVRTCGYDSAEELMKARPGEIIERFEILDEDSQPFRHENLPGRRVLAGGPPSSALIQVRERKSRRVWWSLVRASAVLAADGSPELAINIWHDVTADRREEVRVKYLAEATAALGTSLQSDEMLAALAAVLVPGLGDWCFVHLLDQDQIRNVTIAQVDPAKHATASEELQRFSPKPNSARGIWNVIRTGRPEVYNGVTDEMLVDAAPGPAQLETLRSLGMNAVVLAPIRIRARTVGVITLVSAESNRRYDESLVALLEELGRRAGASLENAELYRTAQDAAKAAEQASRAKDEFLATVSHELRTPLSAILGWSTLLRDRVTDPAVAKPVEVIHRNAQVQVKIIDDILDVSRVITGKFRLDPKPTDLVSIAREAMDVVRPSAVAKKISLEFGSETDLCLLVADPERLQQVVWNLLSNAVKFTDPGGVVRLSMQQDGSNVALSVVDSGKGIEAGFLPFVFDRFKQADSSITRRVGGLGLGLALVRHIVELHGGRVAAASDGIGKGATFTITLPIRAVVPTLSDPPSQRSEASGLAHGAALDGIRVLVVDDEPDARNLILAVLIQAGAVVETAASAVEGFDALMRFRPEVLVSDIGMPDEDGYSFMRRVRALGPSQGGRIPSLALSAFVREEDCSRAMAAGYTAHIGKPVNPDVLTSAIANLATVSRPS